jgi:hypothetical protein
MSYTRPNGNKAMYRDALLKMDRYRTHCHEMMNQLIVLVQKPDSEEAVKVREFVNGFVETREKLRAQNNLTKEQEDEIHPTE